MPTSCGLASAGSASARRHFPAPKKTCTSDTFLVFVVLYRLYEKAIFPAVGEHGVHPWHSDFLDTSIRRMIMKLKLALLVMVFICAPLAVVAGEAGPSSLTDAQLAKMQQRLELTDAQVTEMRKIRDSGGTSKDMRAVLNDEQKAQAKKLKKERSKNKVKDPNSVKGKAKGKGKGKGKGKSGDIA